MSGRQVQSESQKYCDIRRVGIRGDVLFCEVHVGFGVGCDTRADTSDGINAGRHAPYGLVLRICVNVVADRICRIETLQYTILDRRACSIAGIQSDLVGHGVGARHSNTGGTCGASEQ